MIPRNVRLFEWLMYSTVVITLIAAPFNARFYQAIKRFGLIDLPIGLVAIGIFALIIWGIARKRQNWLRWTMAAIFVISLPNIIRGDLLIISVEPLNAWLSLLTSLIQACAYYFIYTGDAVPWFQNREKTADLR